MAWINNFVVKRQRRREKHSVVFKEETKQIAEMRSLEQFVVLLLVPLRRNEDEDDTPI